MDGYLFEFLGILLLGYIAHTLAAFALDLRGLSNARNVFPIGRLRIWRRFFRHLTLNALKEQEYDSQELVVRTSLVKKTEGYGDPTMRYYTHTPELLALQEIAAHLSSYNVEINTDHFYDSGVNKKYLLLLGNDANNRLSKHMLKNLGSQIAWKLSEPPDPTHAPINLHGRAHGCTDLSGEVIADYGLILRRTKADGSVTLLCAGVHAYGTYGAAHVAAKGEFQKYVKSRKAQSFAQLVRVEVIDGKETHDSGITWDEKDFVLGNPLP